MEQANDFRISVSRDFSSAPGFRYRTDGPHSGQQFLEDLLLPRFEAAKQAKSKLFVDLDDVEGYATSFLEGSFGELARRFGAAEVLATLEFKSDQELLLIEEIQRYIREAQSALQPA
jgi:hypothetical protein